MSISRRGSMKMNSKRYQHHLARGDLARSHDHLYTPALTGNNGLDTISYDSDNEMSRRKLELSRNKYGTPLYSKQDFREQYCLSEKQLHCLDKSRAKSIFTCFIDKKSGECGGPSLLSSCYRSDRILTEEDCQTGSLSRPSQQPERHMYHSYTPDRHRYCYHSSFHHPVRNMTVEFAPARCSSVCMVDPPPPPGHVFFQSHDCCHPPHARCRYNTHLEWFRHSAMSDMSPYRHSCCNPPLDVATRGKHVSFDSNLYRSQTLSSIGDQVLCQNDNSNSSSTKNKSQERLLDSRTPDLLEWDVGNAGHSHFSRPTTQDTYRKLSTRSRSTQTHLAARSNSPTNSHVSRPKQRKVRSRSQCAQTASKPIVTASPAGVLQTPAIQRTVEDPNSSKNYQRFILQNHINQPPHRSPDCTLLTENEIMIDYQPSLSLSKTQSVETLETMEQRKAAVFGQLQTKKCSKVGQMEYSAVGESDMFGAEPPSVVDYGEVEQDEEEEESDGVPPPLPPRDYQDEAFHETMMTSFLMGSLNSSDKDCTGISSGSSGGLTCVSPSRYFNTLNASQETVVHLSQASFPVDDTASGEYAVPVNACASSFQSNVGFSHKPLVSTASAPINRALEMQPDRFIVAKPVVDTESGPFPENLTQSLEANKRIFTSALTINVSNTDEKDVGNKCGNLFNKNNVVYDLSNNSSRKPIVDSGYTKEQPKDLQQNPVTTSNLPNYQGQTVSVNESSRNDVLPSTVSKVEIGQTGTRAGVESTTVPVDRQIASVSPMTRSACSLDDSSLVAGGRSDDAHSTSEHSSKTVKLTQYRRYFEENERGELVEVQAPKTEQNSSDEISKTKTLDKNYRRHHKGESRHRKHMQKIMRQKSEELNVSATNKQQFKSKPQFSLREKQEKYKDGKAKEDILGQLQNYEGENKTVQKTVNEKRVEIIPSQSKNVHSMSETNEVTEPLEPTTMLQSLDSMDYSRSGVASTAEAEEKIKRKEEVNQQEETDRSSKNLMESTSSMIELPTFRDNSCEMIISANKNENSSNLFHAKSTVSSNNEDPLLMANTNLSTSADDKNTIDVNTNERNSIEQTIETAGDAMSREKQIAKTVHFKDASPITEENIETQILNPIESQKELPDEFIFTSEDGVGEDISPQPDTINLPDTLPEDIEGGIPRDPVDVNSKRDVAADHSESEEFRVQTSSIKTLDVLPDDLESNSCISENIDEAAVELNKNTGADLCSTENDADISWPEAIPSAVDEDQRVTGEVHPSRVSVHDDSTLQGISSSRTTLEGNIPLCATVTGQKGKLARQDSMPTEASDILTQSETDTDIRYQKSRQISDSVYSQRAKSAERAQSYSHRMDQRTRSEERNTEYSSVPTTSYFASLESSAGGGVGGGFGGGFGGGGSGGRPTDISTLSSLSMSSVGDDESTPGVYMGCFSTNHWLYLNASDEISARKTTQQQQQEKDDSAEVDNQTRAKLERSPSQESTESERDFRRKFLSITHRLVHRRSCMNMLDLVEQNKFGENKCVVMNKSDGEFGFRIHGSKPVVVSAIEKGTPAEVSGLEVGDTIISINGTSVLESNHSEVVRIAHAVTDSLTLQVYSCANLIGDISASDVHRGHLWRKSGDGSWRKRWAVLRHDLSLCFYDNHNDLHPVSAINLAETSVTSSCDNDGKRTLVIHSEKCDSNFEFLTANEEELHIWQLEFEKISSFTSQVFHQQVIDFMAVPSGEIPKPDGRGVLHRLGYGLRGWQKMECVLKDGVLYMYKTANDSSALGALYLHGYRTLSSTGKKPSFELLPPAPGLKHFYFRAETEHHKRRWLAALEYSIDRWVKLTK